MVDFPSCYIRDIAQVTITFMSSHRIMLSCLYHRSFEFVSTLSLLSFNTSYMLHNTFWKSLCCILLRCRDEKSTGVSWLSHAKITHRIVCSYAVIHPPCWERNDTFLAELSHCVIAYLTCIVSHRKYTTYLPCLFENVGSACLVI